MFSRRAVAPTLALAVLAACSSGGPSDADVTFAQSMIPHHEQAVEMADLVEGAGASPEVRDLAARIRAAQDPEIRTMRGWLREWGEDADEHAGHDDHEMAGMMSSDDMAALEDASGAAFDRLWLSMMVEHHEGAVDMADEVLDDGSDPDVASLARDVVETQRAEIAEMETMLDD